MIFLFKLLQQFPSWYVLILNTSMDKFTFPPLIFAAQKKQLDLILFNSSIFGILRHIILIKNINNY